VYARFTNNNTYVAKAAFTFSCAASNNVCTNYYSLGYSKQLKVKLCVLYVDF